MQVGLPRVISSSHLQNLIKIVHSLNKEKELFIDWRKTELIDASGFSILSAISDLCQEANTKVHHLHLSQNLKKYHHPFFELKANSSRPASEDHRSESETRINFCIDGGFTPIFSLLFAEKFSFLNPSIIFHAQLILNELLQNAADHSGSERYYMYAEFKEDHLYLGLLDSGVGIPAKMAQKYSRPSDEEYIDYSFKEGISTRRLREGGYGLFHTFNITKDYEGNLVVLSHEGGIRRYFGQRKVVRLKLSNALKGTWCFIDIKVGFRS